MTVRSSGGDRAFLIGETVHLRSRVSLPGTRTPTDPAVVELASLRLAGAETLSAPVPFVRQNQGEYTLDLQTHLLVAGPYDLTVRHSNGPDQVTLADDSFVLQPSGVTL